MQLDPGSVLLIIVGVILGVALIALLGGGAAMGGMAMMAGMMGTPVGWVALLLIAGLIALVGYMLIYTPG